MPLILIAPYKSDTIWSLLANEDKEKCSKSLNNNEFHFQPLGWKSYPHNKGAGPQNFLPPSSLEPGREGEKFQASFLLAPQLFLTKSASSHKRTCYYRVCIQKGIWHFLKMCHISHDSHRKSLSRPTSSYHKTWIMWVFTVGIQIDLDFRNHEKLAGGQIGLK